MTATSRRANVLTSLLCAALCTTYLAFYTPLPQLADERLALPIARAVADSTMYPATDLLVSSGLRGPFHLYRLAGGLYAQGWNIDLWWYGILIASLFATFVAGWYLVGAIAQNAVVTTGITAMLAAASPYRGSIHWFLFPPPNLVTSTLATPPALAALALALSGRAGPGLLVAALTFNIHPSIGLVTAAAIACTMLAALRRSWTDTWRWWAAALVLAAPNALYMILTTPQNFSAVPERSALSFAEQFRIYAHHAYISDHWRENYGWFLFQVGGIVALRRHIDPSVRRTVLVLVAALLLITTAWFANLYTVNYSGITLTFAIRGVAFIKPIAFAAIGAALVAWSTAASGRQRALRFAVTVTLFAGALHKNLDIGEGLGAIAWGGMVLLSAASLRAARIPVGALLISVGVTQVLGQGWGLFHVAPFSPELTDTARLATIGAALVFVATLPWWDASAATYAPLAQRPAMPSSRSSPAFAALVCAIVFIAALAQRGRLIRLAPASPATIAHAMRLAEPDSGVADVTRWAGTSTAPGSLFALPPADARFTTFRLAAGRGVFASLDEVDQLAYDAANYGRAHTRLLAQGMKVRGRHSFDTAAWNSLGNAAVGALAADGVRYAVFDSAARAAHPLHFAVAFQDARWIVYDLGRVP